MFRGDEQDSFVANTERDAIALATSVTTSWEVAGNWEHALSEFFPRFAEHEIVTAAVGVNVPYMVPVLAFGEKFFKVLEDNKHGSGNHSVVFRPNEWRGTSGSDRQNLNVTAFAAEINNYPKGTVSPIYLTSDGGVRMPIHPIDPCNTSVTDIVVCRRVGFRRTWMIFSIWSPRLMIMLWLWPTRCVFAHL